MPKLNPSKIGLTVGLLLVVLYTLRAIVLLFFPNFVVGIANKVMMGMISINTPNVTFNSYLIGIVVLFVAGFIWGFVFSNIYNLIVK